MYTYDTCDVTSSFCLCTSQKMQLDMMLTSLQENSHVATLLGFSALPDHPSVTALPKRSLHSDMQLVEILMKKLLCNFAFEIVSWLTYAPM